MHRMQVLIVSNDSCVWLILISAHICEVTCNPRWLKWAMATSGKTNMFINATVVFYTVISW